MTLTSQRARTLRPIRKRNTTLLLNINRALRLRRLRLRLLLLFLLLGRLLAVLVVLGLRLALLPLLVAVLRHPLDSTLLRALLPLHRRLLPVALIPADAAGACALVVPIDPLLRAVSRIARFLLAPRLLLLRFHTAADVLNGILLEDRPLARLADNRLQTVFFARLTRRKGSNRLLVDLREDGRGSRRGRRFFIWRESTTHPHAHP